MITSNSEKITVLLLSENHTIKPFDCEDEDLNDFLFKEAILYQKQMLATTFIIGKHCPFMKDLVFSI